MTNKEYYRIYREKNRERIREQHRRFISENPDKVNKYREKYKPKKAEVDRAYYKKNFKAIAEKKKKYQKENAVKIRDYLKKWTIKNTDKIKAYRLLHAEKYRYLKSQNQKKHRSLLSDWIIKHDLAGLGFPKEGLSDDLIWIKRYLTQLQRKIKKQK